MSSPTPLGRKLRYYYQAWQLILQLRNWWVIPGMYLGLIAKTTAILNTGAKFRVGHHLDFLTIKEIYLDNEYGLGTKAKFILDIGANIGTFSTLASQLCPFARILAYEPAPLTFQILKYNLRMNSCRNVSAFKLGLGAKAGRVSFFANPATGLSSMINTRKNNNKKTSIKVMTLAQIFEQQRITRCDFAKIDCEGAEYDIILKTPGNVLKKITQIALEYHDGLLANHDHRLLLERLKSLGYKTKIKKHPLEANIGIIYAHQ